MVNITLVYNSDREWLKYTTGFSSILLEKQYDCGMNKRKRFINKIIFELISQSKTLICRFCLHFFYPPTFFINPNPFRLV